MKQTGDVRLTQTGHQFACSCIRVRIYVIQATFN